MLNKTNMSWIWITKLNVISSVNLVDNNNVRIAHIFM